MINNSINIFFQNLFSSIINFIFLHLDDFLFINTDILNDSLFENFLGQQNNLGLLLISNSLFFGIVLFYIINYVLSNLINFTAEPPQIFIFKSIIFLVCMNSSFWICEKIIYIFSLISNLIFDIGYSLVGSDINFSNILEKSNLLVLDFNIFSLDGILILFISFGLLALYVFFSVRYIWCKILILFSPFAFLSLTNEKTHFIFRTWLWQFLSLLFTQVIISIILVLSFSIDFSSSDIVSRVTLLSIILIIFKCHKIIKQSIFFTSQYNSNLINY